MATYTALLDACVLYPAPLRDLLMRLAVNGVFRAKWTDRIHDEWIRNLLNNRPDLKPEQLERTRSLMNQYAGDALVEGFEYLEAGLSLPDPGDNHVLAAAIHGQADGIVTLNLKDFPPERLEPHGIEVIHPDGFVSCQFDLMPALAAAAIREHFQSLRRPRRSVGEYLATLERCALPLTVYEIRQRGIL
ncbi:MAG: PIN domain-containing protein [Rhodobacterales bacterium]|nr:PIN domain-containing protein [Rhodobacterales bacterium]